MLEKYSSRFGNLLVHLWDMKMALYSDTLDPEKASRKLGDIEIYNEASKLLAFATSLSELLDLDAALILSRRMQKRLHEEGYVVRDFYQEVSDLYSRVKDQLSSRLFFFVRPDKAHYYETPYLFGEEIYNKYPSVTDDVEDAGKCLALGLGTSAVMHLMRVMEVGLKTLSKALGIEEHAPTWDAHLKKIQDNISAKRETKSASWKKMEPFFRDASGDLLTVKMAWRNPSMHIERRYDPDEAEMIFKAVKAFMQRLATRYDENGKKVSSSKKPEVPQELLNLARALRNSKP